MAGASQWPGEKRRNYGICRSLAVGNIWEDRTFREGQTMRNDDLDGDASKPIIAAPRFLRRHLPIALSLCLLAGVMRFWLAPQWARLPADYAEETSYQAQSRARETPAGKWESARLIGRRVDQTLVTSGDTAIVQGDLHWATESGQVLFESAGIYGVDRRTRRNLSGYGNVNRNGQFLFPVHLQRTTYRYWDPIYIGPRTATFERQDMVNGLPVYVFQFAARNLDETAGYTHLPDVPERYQAHTDGEGTLWIEPTSGIVVDYKERGVSYFFDAARRKRAGDFYFWSDHFTAQTKAAQLKSAIAARRRIRTLEIWLPVALLLGGLGCLVMGLRRSSGPTLPVAPHENHAGGGIFS